MIDEIDLKDLRDFARQLGEEKINISDYET